VNPHFFDRLSDHVRNLVRSLESLASVEIEVAIVAPADSDSDVRQVLGIVADEKSAVIEAPNSQAVTDGSVLHELLHLERWWAHQIPRLVLCESHWDPTLERDLTRLDNNLEHLVIVPREVAEFRGRRKHWYDRMEQAWSQIGDDSVMSLRHRIENALQAWPLTSLLFSGTDLERLALMILAEMGKSEVAPRFASELLARRESKIEMVHFVFQELELPPQHVCLEILDVRKRKRHICHLRPARRTGGLP